MMRFLIPLLLVGCKAPQMPTFGTSSATQIISGATESEPLTVLSATGGLCLVAGMILLVITAGKKGWYPVIGGVCLVLLNYMVAEYDGWIFIPVVILSGLISAAWAYKVVVQILSEKKLK